MILPIDPEAEARDLMGRRVEYLLPRELARRGITWLHDLEWNEHEIRAKLMRGEVVISEKVTRGSRDIINAWHLDDAEEWWKPVTKEWARELASRLASFVERKWRLVKDADSEGRTRATLWRDPKNERRYYLTERPGAEPVHLVLGPGVYVDRSPVQEWAVARHLYDHGDASIAEALDLGWVRVETP